LELSSTAYWKPGTYTQFPNDLLGWLVHSGATEHEIKVVLFIARRSLGFHRRQTNGRLDLDDFASELTCDRSTASRAINSLLRRRRIFRWGRQGDYWFYGLYSRRATLDSSSATTHDPNATLHAQAATPPQPAVAAVQRSVGGVSHISSVIQKVTAGGQAANMALVSDSGKKVIKETLKERLKAPSSGSAAASAGAAASPDADEYDIASAYQRFNSQSELEIALRLRCAPKIRQRIEQGLVALAPGVTLPPEQAAATGGCGLLLSVFEDCVVDEMVEASVI
jgi:hypothetical protein